MVWNCPRTGNGQAKLARARFLSKPNRRATASSSAFLMTVPELIRSAFCKRRLNASGHSRTRGELEHARDPGFHLSPRLQYGGEGERRFRTWRGDGRSAFKSQKSEWLGRTAEPNRARHHGSAASATYAGDSARPAGASGRRDLCVATALSHRDHSAFGGKCPPG